MARLRGEGLGTGTVLGTAAVVRVVSGMTLLPEVPERIRVLERAKRGVEIPDVIVIAPTYALALTALNSLQWANVVGIAVEYPEPDAPPTRLPTLLAVSELLASVADDVLLLLDAERGLLFTDPDPVFIAQYQAEAAKIAPRRRVFVEDAHLPARTTDDRVIQVLAWAEDTEQAEAAIAGGADALCVPSGSDLLPETVGGDAVYREALDALLEQTTGKPLLIIGDATLPALPLLEAAVRADVTLVLRSAMPLSDALGALQRAEAEALEEEIPVRLPRLAVDISTAETFQNGTLETDWITKLAEDGATRLFCRLDYDVVADFVPVLENIVSTASAALLPVIVRLAPGFLHSEETLEEDVRRAALQNLVGAGVTQIVVGAAQVPAFKTLVGETSYFACRQQALKAEK